MAEPRCPASFKWGPLASEVILYAVRWHLQCSRSYHEFQELLVERGVEVDHTIGWRCVQRHVQELEERTRSNLEPTSKPRRVTLLIFAIHPPKGRNPFQTV